MLLPWRHLTQTTHYLASEQLRCGLGVEACMRRCSCLLLGWVLFLTPGFFAVAENTEASASVVLQESYVEGYKGSGGFQGQVTVTGSDGGDHITVQQTEIAVVVEDPGGVTAGLGCAADADALGTRVRCATRGYMASGLVRGGAGDDVIDAANVSVAGGPGDDTITGAGSLRGGDGDDALTGSPGPDMLIGNAGDDRLDGRGGVDGAVYADRADPVTADLRRQAVAVGDSEHDVLVSIEGVVGGMGPDRLTGSGGDDVLFGWGGDDLLFGAGGDDELRDGSGADRLEGGSGNDFLSAGDLDAPLAKLAISSLPKPPADARGATLLGGPGQDGLSGGPGDDRLDGGPGRDGITATGGADRVWARDRHFDEMRCSANAVVRVDRFDLTSGCRRLQRTGTPRPVITSVGGVTFEENDGRYATAYLSCSDDQHQGCRGQLRVVALGRPVGRAWFAVRPGRTQALEQIDLSDWVHRLAQRQGRLRVLYVAHTADARGRRVTITRRGAFCPARDPDDCRP